MTAWLTFGCFLLFPSPLVFYVITFLVFILAFPVLLATVMVVLKKMVMIMIPMMRIIAMNRLGNSTTIVQIPNE